MLGLRGRDGLVAGLCGIAVMASLGAEAQAPVSPPIDPVADFQPYLAMIGKLVAAVAAVAAIPLTVVNFIKGYAETKKIQAERDKIHLETLKLQSELTEKGTIPDPGKQEKILERVRRIEEKSRPKSEREQKAADLKQSIDASQRKMWMFLVPALAIMISEKMFFVHTKSFYVALLWAISSGFFLIISLYWNTRMVIDFILYLRVVRRISRAASGKSTR